MGYEIKRVSKMNNGNIGVNVTFTSEGGGFLEFPSNSTDVDIKSAIAALDANNVAVVDPQNQLSSNVKALVGYKG